MATVHVVDECDLKPDVEAAIRRSLVTCFAKDAAFFSCSRAWHGSAPSFSAYVLEGEEVIAHLGVVQRRVTIDEMPYDVAGLQNVCVLPDHRGQGLCSDIVDAAMVEARGRELDFGLLFCVAATIPVYERCGWLRLLDQAVVRVDLDGAEKPLEEGNLPMWCPLGREEFPAGTVHLGGNDW